MLTLLSLPLDCWGKLRDFDWYWHQAVCRCWWTVAQVSHFHGLSLHSPRFHSQWLQESGWQTLETWPTCIGKAFNIPPPLQCHVYVVTLVTSQHHMMSVLPSMYVMSLRTPQKPEVVQRKIMVYPAKYIASWPHYTHAQYCTCYTDTCITTNNKLCISIVIVFNLPYCSKLVTNNLWFFGFSYIHACTCIIK